MPRALVVKKKKKKNASRNTLLKGK
jgi:hypothetical protein